MISEFVNNMNWKVQNKNSTSKFVESDKNVSEYSKEQQDSNFQ